MIIVRVLSVLLVLWLSLGLLYGRSDADALSSGAATDLLYIVGLVVLVVPISAIPTLQGIRLACTE